MKDPRGADCVMETLIESEQQWKLCRFSAWVVMPNHVHALLCPSEKLSKVLLVIKSASARRANRLLERTGQRFWQDESFDHWMRDGYERNQIIRYIEWNPVKAALAAAPENWPWSSASRSCPPAQYFPRQVMDLSYISVNHKSLRPPPRGGALTRESSGDADQRNAARRRNVPARGIVSHVQLRSCDLRGERSERPIMRAHAGKQRPLDTLMFCGAAAFVHQHRCAGFSERAQQFAL